MTLKQIYNLAIEKAIAADPRGRVGVEKSLARLKKEFDELSEKKKADFDQESLTNPYSDSRILIGGPNLKVDKVMAGIDINPAEVVIAHILNQKTPKKTIDLLISHHPIGGSYAALHEVMGLQVDLLVNYGVPVNIAESILKDRISEVSRSLSPRNHNEAVDAARLLDFSIMCTHTTADNLVYDFLEKLIAKTKPETVGEVMEALLSVPEYQEAKKGNAGPMIFVGSEKNQAGRVAPIEITGGTEGSPLIYEKMAQAGIGTIIGMHASEEHRKECQKHHMNMVVAGHMSSDSLGMNLFLDGLEKKGIEIVPCSGLIRISRI